MQNDTTQLSEEAHRWDVLFFIRGVPIGLGVAADNVRMAIITQPTWPMLEKLIELLPDERSFFEGQKADVSVFAFKTVAYKAHDALRQAHEKAHNYMDAITAAGFPVPVLSHVAQVRKNDHPDVDIHLFYRDRWLQQNPNKMEVIDKWKLRSRVVVEHIVPVLSQIIEKPWDQHGELEKRALYSMKLFRKGIESQAFGVEYVCKFAALENLVIGGELGNKGRKLVFRLSALVGDIAPDIGLTVKKLWELRHKIVHEAKIEFLGGDPDAYPVHVHMEELNWLFQVALVFLADHFGSVASLAELWSGAEKYSIPDGVVEKRPPEIGLFPASSWSETQGLVWLGGGILLDDLWSRPL